MQPYRNLIDDAYESSGLKRHVDDRDLGVAFFSPLKHGLLLGKYDAPQHFAEGDFRTNVPEFEDAEFIARMRRAREEVTHKFADRREPVIHALTGALLAGSPTACVLLGQRNRQQVEAAAQCGTDFSLSDAEWVKKTYNAR